MPVKPEINQRLYTFSAVINALSGMDLEYPEVNKEKVAELKALRQTLMDDK